MYKVESCVFLATTFQLYLEPTVGKQLVCKRDVSNTQETGIEALQMATVVYYKSSTACSL